MPSQTYVILRSTRRVRLEGRHTPMSPPDDSRLRPEREAEAGAGARRGAVARLVERPFEREMLDRAGDADPVADFRAARVELFARQGLERLGVLLTEQVEEAAV